MALDKRTGKQRWRVDRDEDTSWATPIVVEHAGKAQVIVPGTNRLRGYDLANGRVIWECGGLSSNIVASPVAADGVVYAGSSYDTRALLAIRLDGAKGDITGTRQVVWTRIRGTPYVPSPLLYGDSLYFLTHYQGILSRVDAKTGEDRPGPVRLDGIDNVYASPVAAAGRIYVTDLDGATMVMSHGDTPRSAGPQPTGRHHQRLGRPGRPRAVPARAEVSVLHRGRVTRSCRQIDPTRAGKHRGQEFLSGEARFLLPCQQFFRQTG